MAGPWNSCGSNLIPLSPWCKMRLGFSETMAGSCVDAAGLSHAVSFTVRASDEGRGYFRLAGTALADSYFMDVPCNGALVIGLGYIRYRVRCFSNAGDWWIAGQKSPTVLHPLRSMVTLPVTLSDPSGMQRAAGTLLFRMRDLPSFLFSAVWP